MGSKPSPLKELVFATVDRTTVIGFVVAGATLGALIGAGVATGTEHMIDPNSQDMVARIILDLAHSKAAVTEVLKSMPVDTADVAQRAQDFAEGFKMSYNEAYTHSMTFAQESAAADSGVTLPRIPGIPELVASYADSAIAKNNPVMLKQVIDLCVGKVTALIGGGAVGGTIGGLVGAKAGRGLSESVGGVIRAADQVFENSVRPWIEKRTESIAAALVTVLPQLARGEILHDEFDTATAEGKRLIETTKAQAGKLLAQAKAFHEKYMQSV